MAEAESGRVRLFVGVALPPRERELLASRLPPRARLPRAAEEIRWLPEHNWHLTLQFLGSVDAALLPALSAACAQAAASCAAFELALGGAGAFPSPRRAHVLWVGITRGQAELGALAEALLARTEPLGFVREQRAFHAHLTVARMKKPANVEPLLAALKLPELGTRVQALTLFRSHLSSKGAEYEALEEHPLTEP